MTTLSNHPFIFMLTSSNSLYWGNHHYVVGQDSSSLAVTIIIFWLNGGVHEGRLMMFKEWTKVILPNDTC